MNTEGGNKRKREIMGEGEREQCDQIGQFIGLWATF